MSPQSDGGTLLAPPRKLKWLPILRQSWLTLRRLQSWLLRKARSLPPLMLCLLAAVSLCLGACQTLNGTPTTAASQCAAWRAISYSSSKDTPPTIDQIRTHNLVGKKLGCWK